jgi:putative transposase
METSWHHAPVHIFTPGSVYMVTAGTIYKQHFFHGYSRLALLQESLLGILDQYSWKVHAWAVFPNHYHWIACAPETGPSLAELIKELHSVTAIRVNRLDRVQDRQVWFQYWDTHITYEKSWLVRLNYVNNNAIHHRLVRTPALYPYCSAAWFEQKANPGFRRKVQSFKYNRLRIVDDFWLSGFS